VPGGMADLPVIEMLEVADVLPHSRACPDT
jgi:hypothetical protein